MIVSRIMFLALLGLIVIRETTSNIESAIENEALEKEGADANVASKIYVTGVRGASNAHNFFNDGLPLESNMGSDAVTPSSDGHDMTEAMIRSVASQGMIERKTVGKTTKKKKDKKMKKKKLKTKKKRRKKAQRKKKKKVLTTEAPTTEAPTEVEEIIGRSFKSAPDSPFGDLELPYFNSDIVDGYSSCSDLRDDILTVARIQANAIIEQQAQMGDDYPLFRDKTESIASPESEDASDGYETNNQVRDVHEADIIKSNGEEIYAAYGDKVVVLDVAGEILSEITMPQLQDLGDCKQPPVKILPVEENNEVNEVAEEKTIETGPPRRTIAIPYPCNDKPKVRGLLLHNNTLAVVVDSWRNWCPYATQPILSDYGRTHIRLYDISDPTNLVLLGTRNLQGTYRDARRIKEHAYFVSVTHVNTWSITWPLYRWNSDFDGLNATEYRDKAKRIATNTTIDFADRLVEEMNLKELDCANMARISMMETGNRTDNGSDVDSSYANGIINGYAQVTAVDMQHDYGVSEPDFDGKNTTLSAHVSGIFLRTSWLELYASKTMLVLFGTGYQWNFWSSTQTTYLCAFHLHNGTATPTAIGSVPGDLLDQFSIDHKDDYLRVASTEFGEWEWSNETEMWIRQTNNRITILEFPDDAFNKSVLNEVGFIDGLGDPGERIFAVRYVGDMAYVVTFRQTDPFYIIDVSDATKPAKVGELKISGFSNYLHSVNNNTLLAVGQEANNETGAAIGLQLSMFDVSNSSDPSLLIRYTVEDEEGIWSRSDAQIEHKAFRYLKSLQKLILPASISGKVQFDGFLVFGVNETHIEYEFNITHTSYWGRCHYDAYLQARSIVVDGEATTFKGHTIQNHDLATGTKLWNISLDENLPREYCCWGG